MNVPVTAVVHAAGASVAVWHVDVRATPLLTQRNVGAWRFGSDDLDMLRLVLARRYILATPQAEAPLGQCRVETLGTIDMPATRETAEADIRRQREAFTAELARTPKLIEPDWVSFDRPCPIPQDVPDPRRGALDVANWLGDVCDTWRQMEDQRLVRRSLRALAGSLARPLPLVVQQCSADWGKAHVRRGRRRNHGVQSGR